MGKWGNGIGAGPEACSHQRIANPLMQIE